MALQQAVAAPPTLSARYQAVRDETEALASPLTAEDQTVQSMADVSPTKWHRAHITWFFETFLLKPHLPGYEPVDPAYEFLFNSYYETVGDRHPRPQRGLITRPTVADVTDYRRRVDEAMHTLIDTIIGDRPDLVDLVELGLNHEQQHQELMGMDIKHVFSSTIVKPAYRERPARPAGGARPLGWRSVDGGITTIGHAGDGFHFDNEGPAHEVLLRPYRLADRLVSCGEWLEFIADGGYETATLWLSDGWYAVQQNDWRAPLYWRSTGERRDDAWVVHTLSGERPVDPAEPVVHVSYYEADAFARWAGARLPTEFEWERYATGRPVEGNLLPAGNLHPVPAADRDDQLYGDVWEWTSSSYSPYPGFRPAEGAVGEYNGKFMIDQQVLRGGCAITPGGHVRPTYRNFFPARARWQFGGVRLARDADAS